MSATREDIDRLKLPRTDPIDFYNYLVNVKYGRKPPRAALRNALCDFYDAAWQIGKESSLPNERHADEGGFDAAVVRRQYTEMRFLCRQLERELAAREGYVLVPREPTEEMVRAAYAAQPDAINAGFAEAYRAMLTAAEEGKI